MGGVPQPALRERLTSLACSSQPWWIPQPPGGSTRGTSSVTSPARERASHSARCSRVKGPSLWEPGR